MSDFKTLPKVDLHRHLEGSLRPATLWEFHAAQRQELHANFEALLRSTTLRATDAPGFSKFLGCFDGLRFYYGGVEAIERVAAECVADAADDGVIHLEIRFAPVFFARRMLPDPGPLDVPPSGDLTISAARAGIDGAQREAAKREMTVSFIACMGRHYSVEVNRPTADLLRHPLGSNFTGIDIAGHESFSALPFKPLIDEWRNAGRGVTIHAGEDCEGRGAENIREAVEQLGASRIGHGLRALDDPKLIQLLITRDVTLEMCPTSNFQTRACSTLASHPLKTLLQSGVRVTINSDDPAISSTTLSHEFKRAHDECGLSFRQLKQCALYAAGAAYAPESRKQELSKLIHDSWKD